MRWGRTPRGDNEYRRLANFLLGPDGFADRKTVQLGHFNIEQQDVGLQFGELLQRDLAVFRSVDTKTGLLQDVPEYPPVRAIVVGNQDEWFVRSVFRLIHVSAAP
jgi:hypothetical protein